MCLTRTIRRSAGLIFLLQLTAATCEGEQRTGYPIRFLQGVSSRFQDEIQHAVRTIPRPVWDGLARRGWRVHAAPSVTEAAPWLKGTQPRGWPAGYTWDHSDAVHLPESRLLVLGETRQTGRGDRIPSSRIGGVLRHELGHAFDMLLGCPRRFQSLTPAFTAAYRQDTHRLSTQQRSTLRYYLQARSAGYQETFAEAFATILGGGSDVTLSEEFTQGFPTVLNFVEQSIQGYTSNAPES